ncbi:hypothetical protein Javan174_0021 [Streptococcus phage Javan174]|uniref:hypothetical protein n=1 Tax=Streptococcus entericus TaxID=155680 RepID=UPI00035E0B76|nr:hypothetical protein [Streptococcus entericus]QBX24087.1 hypothetical protein Javan174_0021 [Streptococcus phage Javan174]
MTQFDVILILLALFCVTWSILITVVAIITVKKHKEHVLYYQRPDIQDKITQHTLNNRLNGQTGVFK